MRSALVFTFAAPLASFGAVAVGERRPSWDRPGKSQVIGLLCCALGIERADEVRQAEVAESLKLAIRIDDPGHLATDYHTTQVPPQRRNRRFATRAEELNLPKRELKTILSRREYRVGSRYTIAVWYEPDRPEMLDRLRTRLREPAFLLFAGRKAFPLMLPPHPQIVTLDDGIEPAFQAYDDRLNDDIRELLASVTPRRRYRPQIFVDADAVPRSQPVDRIEERRDIPENRGKWRFGLRSEVMLRQSRPNEEPAS